MYNYDIKVAVSEKWTWKCTHCGLTNTQCNSTFVRGWASEFYDAFKKSSAERRCADDIVKQLSELEYEYYNVNPQYRNYERLSLNLSCSHCRHREIWACPNAFSRPTITSKEKKIIEAMNPENLPTIIEHQFTPIPVEERKKQENEKLIVGAVLALLFFFICFIIYSLQLPQ